MAAVDCRTSVKNCEDWLGAGCSQTARHFKNRGRSSSERRKRGSRSRRTPNSGATLASDRSLIFCKAGLAASRGGAAHPHPAGLGNDLPTRASTPRTSAHSRRWETARCRVSHQALVASALLRGGCFCWEGAGVPGCQNVLHRLSEVVVIAKGTLETRAILKFGLGLG
jgi:hypothetical protein